eukprot:TRINITY_DN711_c0_g1_i1.p1 TRINITY_DN711_c0_g1~~TRINITY_DN711_c0_g1_i1.p1  ORF type:complete len:202 (+),score=27.52 TRINITY_DN711_c0_g1_i1:240-845(+)
MASEQVIKLLIIGDSNVGKSSILLRFTESVFTDGPVQMTSVDFKSRSLRIDGVPVQLQIWDTAGQERFRTITSSFYRGAHGIIIVYDVTDQSSYNNVKLWMQEIARYAPPTVSKMLLGNKTDLEPNRVIPTSVAEEYAKSSQYPFFETSAQSGKGVDEAFTRIASDVLKMKSAAATASGTSNTIKPSPVDTSKGKKKSGGC